MTLRDGDGLPSRLAELACRWHRSLPCPSGGRSAASCAGTSTSLPAEGRAAVSLRWDTTIASRICPNSHGRRQAERERERESAGWPRDRGVATRECALERRRGAAGRSWAGQTRRRCTPSPTRLTACSRRETERMAGRRRCRRSTPPSARCTLARTDRQTERRMRLQWHAAWRNVGRGDSESYRGACWI